MDGLSKVYSQLLDQWRAMKPKARFAAIVVIAVAVLGAAVLGRYELAEEMTYLLGGQAFSSDEITTIQGALGKAQLNDFSVEGNRIRIPQNKQAAYLAALADGNALPQTTTDIFSEATEKTTWFTSRYEQLEHAKTAKKKVLSQILRSMNGVQSADVDFDREEPRGLRQERSATAFVAVKLCGGEPLDEDRAACFQRMAAAMLMMAPQDVTVADKATNAVFGGRAGSAMHGAMDEYRLRKRQYEADYEQQVHKALKYVSGVTVSANVELEQELCREEKRIEVITQGTANQPASLRASPSVLESGDQPLAPSGDSPPAHNETTIESAGLTPKRVAISIGVPTSHFEAVWRQSRSGLAGKGTAAAPAAELARIQAEEIARIRGAVAALLPAADPTTDASQLVTVTPFSHSLAEVPAASLGVVDWLSESWAVLGGIGLAIAGLLLIRFMLRASRGKVDADPFDRHPQLARAGARPRPEDRSTPNRSLREQLVDRVREDPVKAANVLRSWIGNVN
jgi:flagellar biosynthesis/type III secretory pathway M-ring protein FliF/YscJ